MKVLIAQSGRTLCNPIDYSPPGSSVHGILQARTLECTSQNPRQPFPSHYKQLIYRSEGGFHGGSDSKVSACNGETGV